MKSRYIFNKTTDLNPVDRHKIFVQVNYDNEAIVNQAFPQVGIKNLRFAREDVAVFYNWIQSSNTGVFYAPYFDIELTSKGNTYTIPMYLDLSDGLEYSVDGIEASIKLYMSLDWLNDRVDSFTFESVVLGVANGDYPNVAGGSDALCASIINTRTKYVPYVITTIPNYIHAFMGLVTCVAQGMAVIKEIDVIVSMFAPDAVGIFTSIPTFIGFLIHTAYVIVMIATLLTNILMFIFAIVQPVKYHACMLIVDLLEAACAELGVGFQSSIWQSAPYNQLALIPEKYIPVANGSTESFNISGIFNVNFIIGGYTEPTPSKQQGYPIMTGGDLFRLAKSMCNGKILFQEVAGPTLIMERRDWVPVVPKFQMDDIRQDWHGFNTKEFNATTIISFTKDLNDKNTFDQYQGEKLSAVVTCTNQPDPLLVLTKGLREITIDAARGVRKESLTMPEIFINEFALAIDGFVNTLTAVANGVISALNGIISVVNAAIHVLHFLGIIKHPTYMSTLGFLPTISSPANSSTNRFGMLQMEQDLVNVAKIVMLDTANGYQVNGQDVLKIHPMNSSVVNAQYLWNFFYAIDCFVPIDMVDFPVYTDTQGNGCATPINVADNGKHNQFTLWSPALAHSSDKNSLSLSFADFMLLAQDNNFIDASGNPLIIDSLNWYHEDSKADIQYRKNELYDKNLNVLVTLPNGQ